MTLVIWVFCLFESMKILFLFICVIQAFFINAQSLIGLIDRDNSLSITNAEGQGVSIIGLSRGPGINKTSGNAIDYNSFGWDESSLSSAIVDGDYIQFTISVNQGFILDLDELMIRIDRSPQGPINFELLYSTDNFVSYSSIYNLQNISSANPQTYAVNTSTINTLTSNELITFRLYCWGATSSVGTMDIEGFIPTYSPYGWQPSNSVSSDPGLAFLGCTASITVANASIWPINVSSVKIEWDNPKCLSQIVIIGKEGSQPSFNPSNRNCNGINGDCISSNFSSISSFGDGLSNTNLPQNEYCVYKGIGDNATITNLVNGKNYYFKIYTYLNPWSDNALSPVLNVSALPVDFISFKGKLNNGIVQLNWQTGFELNNDFFDVQNSMDGIKFNTIGVINGHGNSSQVNEYFFEDINPRLPKSYYPLKQVDFNGSSTYSKVICINLKKDEFIIQEQLDYVQINTQLSDNVEFVIINSYGIEIDSGKFNKSVKINKNKFISGIYFIKLKTPYHEEILKLGLNQ